MYNENVNSRYSVLKSEKEKLNPLEAEEEGIYIDYPVQVPKHKMLTEDDCETLDIQALENLDRLGYKLPAETKERVMEYREAYQLHYPKNQ